MNAITYNMLEANQESNKHKFAQPYVGIKSTLDQLK